MNTTTGTTTRAQIIHPVFIGLIGEKVTRLKKKLRCTLALLEQKSYNTYEETTLHIGLCTRHNREVNTTLEIGYGFFSAHI